VEVSEELELISGIQKGLPADGQQHPPAGPFCFSLLTPNPNAHVHRTTSNFEDKKMGLGK
jgi:hypothetical protein